MFNVILLPLTPLPLFLFLISRVLGNPLDIVGREVCVQGNWKMVDREEERESGVFVGGRRLGHSCIFYGGTVSRLCVCALFFVFEPVTLLVWFVKLSLGCERCSS